MGRFKKGELPPVGAKPWAKGQSGNPRGPKPLPPDIKAIRKLSSEEFERVCSSLMSMSLRRLKEIAKTETTPVLQALVARVLLKGIDESSRIELNFFIERFLGKVAENHNVTGNVNKSLVDFIASRRVPEDDDDDE